MVMALMEDLRRTGHEVGLVSEAGSYALRTAAGLGMTVFEARFFRSRLDLSVSLRLARFIRGFAFDVVHVHGARAGFFAGFVPRNSGFPPFVYTVHGYHFLHKPTGIRHAAALAERRASFRSEETIFTSQHDLQVAIRWGILRNPARGTVICNGVRWQDVPGSGGADEKCVGFLGRLTHAKDPILFLQTLRILASEGFTAKIIGGGDMAHEIGRFIGQYGLEEAVRLTGPLSREQALTELAGVGLLLMTSRWEGTPLAALEAMHMGIPVVAADVSGMGEIIESGVTGALVRGRNPEDYAHAVREIACDFKFRLKLVDNAQKVARKRFSQDRVTSDYIALYKRVLANHRSAK